MSATDKCATCDHPKRWHNMDDGCRQYMWGSGVTCKCSCYLPSRPAPEETRPEFDPPHIWEEGA